MATGAFGGTFMPLVGSMKSTPVDLEASAVKGVLLTPTATTRVVVANKRKVAYAVTLELFLFLFLLKRFISSATEAQLPWIKEFCLSVKNRRLAFKQTSSSGRGGSDIVDKPPLPIVRLCLNTVLAAFTFII